MSGEEEPSLAGVDNGVVCIVSFDDVVVAIKPKEEGDLETGWNIGLVSLTYGGVDLSIGEDLSVIYFHFSVVTKSVSGIHTIP